jgi:hypothetical protein
MAWMASPAAAADPTAYLVDMPAVET